MTVPKMHESHEIPPGMVDRKDLIEQAEALVSYWSTEERNLLAAGITGDLSLSRKLAGLSTSKEVLPDVLRARWAANQSRDFVVAARCQTRPCDNLRFDADVAVAFAILHRGWNDRSRSCEEFVRVALKMNPPVELHVGYPKQKAPLALPLKLSPEFFDVAALGPKRTHDIVELCTRLKFVVKGAMIAAAPAGLKITWGFPKDAAEEPKSFTGPCEDGILKTVEVAEGCDFDWIAHTMTVDAASWIQTLFDRGTKVLDVVDEVPFIGVLPSTLTRRAQVFWAMKCYPRSTAQIDPPKPVLQECTPAAVIRTLEGLKKKYEGNGLVGPIRGVPQVPCRCGIAGCAWEQLSSMVRIDP